MKHTVINLKRIYLLCFLALMQMMFLGSCSSSDDEGSKAETEQKEELSEDARRLCADMYLMQKHNVIDAEECQSAIDDIKDFDENGFFGKYWYLILIFIYWGITVYAALNCISKDEADPISRVDVYLFWLFSAPWAGHLLYLRKVPMMQYGRHKTMYLSWFILSAAACLIVLFSNYNAWIPLAFHPYVLFSYVLVLYIPRALLLGGIFTYLCFIVLFYNIVITFFAIPYKVYVYKNLYYRHHYENRDIMKGYTTSADKVCREIEKELPQIQKSIKETTVYINDDGYVTEDPDRDDGLFASIGRGLKNVFTLGASGRLNKKMDRMRCLAECCDRMQEHILRLQFQCENLGKQLSACRKAAYRDMYLAKELIGMVKKKMSSKEQTLRKDDFKLDNPETISVGVPDVSDVSYNSEAVFDNLSNELCAAFEDFGTKMEKTGKITKDDVIAEAAVRGVEVASQAISELLNYNSNLRERIAEVERQMEEAVDYLEKALHSAEEYEKYIKRYAEIIKALNECNKAFVKAYEPICDKVFGKPSVIKFLFGLKKNNPLYETEEFRKDLHHLIQVCSEYNKINTAK